MESTRSEEFHVYTFAPLLNFHTDAPEIKMADGCVIGPPSDAEIQWCKAPAYGWMPELWPTCSCVIRTGIQKIHETEILSGGKFGTPWFGLSSMGQITKVRNSLRLFRRGDVGCGPRYTMLPGTSEPGFHAQGDNTFPCDLSKAYTISIQEAPLFSAFYDKFRFFDFDKHPEVQIAVLRFCLSYEVGWLYQPIDLMIGFEALYLGDEQELAYKLATRASYLLGETPDRRLHIYRVLRKAYSIRSKLVHGEKDIDKVKTEKGKYIPINEFLSEVQDVLRESINRFMALAAKYSHKQLLQTALDDNVINGGNLLSQT